MTRLALLVPLLAIPLGCAEYDMSPEDRSDSDNGEAPGNGDNDDGAGGLEPEAPDAYIPLMPAQTDVYVFVANPSLGTVTRVNVQTREVRTTSVGLDPQIVLTTPDYAHAVAFNRGDDTVTLIDASTLETTTVAVRRHFNRMVMSPDGRWVALWHDVNARRPDDPPATGIQSFNEVSLVDLSTAEHFAMAVGFNPRAIQFTDDSTLGVVVSDTYLALLDLTLPVPRPDLVQVSDDLVDPPAAEQVALTPDGAFAFVRQFGADDLVLVDLATHDVSSLPVGIDPTDLDLTPDGARAVVISRGSGQVHVFDTTDPFLAPEILDLPEGVVLGSLTMSPDGEKAILYSTAVLQDRYATWDLTTDQIQVRSLVKPVAGVAVTPTGGSLMVFHTQQDAPDADPSPFTGKWALSLIDLGDFRANPLLLPAEPIGFANATSGERGYLILDGTDSLAVLDYRTLLADEIRLRSHPVFVGVLPDLAPADGDEPPAWVSQEHPLGRISFYDPDDGSVETLTGFELNAQIED